MKILFINDYGTLTGGAEIAIFRISHVLQDKGHQVAFFSSTAAEKNMPLISTQQCYGTLGRARTYLQVANFSAYRQLKKALNEFKPDVIHLFIYLTQLSPLILSLIRRYPAVVTLCFYRELCPKGTLMLPNGEPCREKWGKPCLQNKCLSLHQWASLEIQRHLFNRKYSSAIKAVAVSETVKLRFENAGWSGISVIPMGAEKKELIADFAEKPLVTFVGRLVKEKGVWVLLEAFLQLLKWIPDATLWIAGNGPELENIKKWVIHNRVAGAVKLYDYVPIEKLDQLFSPAWIQVIPSLWDEPSGIAVVQAMMRGTPAIITENGGWANRITTGQNGWLVPPGKSIPLFEAMKEIISDTRLRDSISREAHIYAVKNLDIVQTTDAYVELYREMLS